MRFEQVFDHLTFKLIDALRKQIQSIVDSCFELRFLDCCHVNQILIMIVRIKLV